MSTRRPSSRGKPFQSKLEPFAAFIRDLRRRRNSYREIAARLRKGHGVTVSPSTIFSFVKVRSKHRKFYVMAEDGSACSVPILQGFDPIEALRRKPIEKPKEPLFVFDENKPLTLKP
jgi:hypothetical protein